MTGPRGITQSTARTADHAGAGNRYPLLTALGIDALGSGLYLPLSLIYFTVVSGLPLAEVGFVLSAAIAVSLPVPLLAGSWADRFGARRVVVGAQLLQAIGFFCYLFVHNIVALFVAALIVGLGERAFWTTVYTFVAQSADNRVLDTWFARVSVIRNLGVGVGALLAGVVLGIGKRGLYQAAIIGNTVSFVIAALLLALLVREARPAGPRKRLAKGGYRQIMRDRPFLAFTATNLVYSLCLSMVTVALSVYVVEGLSGPGWVVGVLFGVNTGVIIVAQSWVTKRLGGRRRTRVLMAAGVLWTVWSLSLAVADLIPRALLIPFLFAGMLLFTIAEMVQSPTSTALAAAASVDELQGRYMAVYQYGYQCAKIIAPVLFTQLYALHRSWPWLVLAVLTAGTAPLLLRLERSLPAAAVNPPEPVGTTP